MLRIPLQMVLAIAAAQSITLLVRRPMSGCAVFYEQLEANSAGNASRAGSLAAQALVLQMQADSLSVANEFGSLLQVCM